MSQDAVLNTTTLPADAQDALVGVPDQLYIDRVPQIIAQFMRGYAMPLSILWQRDQKKIFVVKGDVQAATDTINALETEASGSGGMDIEVFAPPADQLLQTTAEFAARNGSFSISRTPHSFDVLGVVEPITPVRVSLTTLLERLHVDDQANTIFMFQGARTDLEAFGSLDANYSQGSVYVLKNAVTGGHAGFDSIDAAADFVATYTDGEPGTAANPQPVKDTFGL